MSESVQVSAYLTRDIKVRLKTELARRELGFSQWLREQAAEWLDEQNHQTVGTVSGQPK